MRDLPIRVVRLPGGTPFESLHDLKEDFPSLTFERGGARIRGDAVIDLGAWSASATFEPFDEAVEQSITGRLVLEGDEDGLPAVPEVLTRYQRWFNRRTGASRDAVFDRVLSVHRQLHDCGKPLVRADLDHAIDTWQWLLRLDPNASLALQLAAIFHDVERLESEADQRVEHRVRDYRSFKDLHAQRGSDVAFDVLVDSGIDRSIATRTRELIASHERPHEDREVAVLNDADGLSFFSLNSAGYLDYFGALQTRRKISYTLARLGRKARFRMAAIRMRPDVETLFAAVVRA